MHKTQLGSARTALVRGSIADLRAEPLDTALTVARAEPGVVLALLGCQIDWCRVKAEGYRGWVRKSGLWGVLGDDVFEED